MSIVAIQTERGLLDRIGKRGFVVDSWRDSNGNDVVRYGNGEIEVSIRPTPRERSGILDYWKEKRR